MNRRRAGTVLLILGGLLLTYAMLFMDISIDGRIANISLLNTRQNLVIIGSLGIVAGLILSFVASPQNPGPPEAMGPGWAQKAKRVVDTALSHMRNLRTTPVRSARIGSLLLMPIGAYVLYFYLFEPTGGSGLWVLFAAFALYFGPVIANRGTARELSVRLTTTRILFLAVVLLTLIVYLLNKLAPY